MTENNKPYQIAAICEPPKVTIKGSYFPGEDYEFESTSDKLEVFVEMLKARGCYISEDGHIRSKRGGMMSKLMRNGYYLTMAQYNRKQYYFCEHRVIWVWHHGAIPKGKEINHRDYNRANNKIENLEIVSHSENMQYSRPNLNPCRGERSHKSKISDKEAKVHDIIECPVCHTKFEKIQWMQAFCCGQCKDKFHNMRCKDRHRYAECYDDGMTDHDWDEAFGVAEYNDTY